MHSSSPPINRPLRLARLVLLASVPVGLLATGEYLPRALRPMHPTYTKYFCTQTLLVVGLIALLIGLAHRPRRHAESVRAAAQRYLFPLLLLCYATWCVVGVLWSSWPYGTVNYVLRETAFFALAVGFFVVLGNRRHWRTFALLFMLCATAAAFWQAQSNVWMAWAEEMSLNQAFLRRSLMFGNPNFAASTVTTGALIAVGFALVAARRLRADGADTQRRTLILRMAGCAAAAGVLLFILITARSLAGYVAALLAAVAYAICMLPLRRRHLVAGGLAGAGLLAALIVLNVPDLRRAAIRRALRPGTTTRARVVWWTATSDMFAEKPLRGWGAGTYGSAYYHFSPPLANEAPPTRGVSATHPHNEFLRVAAETGVVGLLLYCIMVGAALVSAYRALRGAPFDLRAVGFALWAGLLGYLVQAALGKGVQAWDLALPYWMLLGTVASAALWKRPAGRTVRERPIWIWPACALAAGGLLLWWWLAAVGSYRSTLHLRVAREHLRGFASYAQKKYGQAGDPAVRERARQIAAVIDPVISRAQPRCPLPTTPVKFRYWLGVNLSSLGAEEPACRHFRLVQGAAPGFLQVERHLAFCHLRKGQQRMARGYLVDFLTRHPGTDTEVYVALARIDLQRAAALLAAQVAERDRFTHAPRTALMGRMLAGMGNWDDVRNLLRHTRRVGTPAALKALGEELTRFCREFDKQERLSALRKDHPAAFAEP